MLRVLVSLLFIILLSGCSHWFGANNNDEFGYLKGQHIMVVIKGFNRNPDTIEDWTDYKRYTWRVCKATGNSVIGNKDNNNYHLKQEVRCCDVVFDTNRSNIIISNNDNELKNCPININFKKIS